MKTLIITFILLLGIGLANGQKVKELRPVEKKHATNIKNPVIKVKPIVKPVVKNTFIGDFTITGYHILSLSTPGHKELERMVGSLVKVNLTSITGTEINPITFILKDAGMMTKDDYITTVFGREVRIKDPDLPYNVFVHHTDNKQSPAFIELDPNHLAIPYRGVLLFLERK